MKIAIPSNDQSSICKHFGKAKGFVICEIEDNKIVAKNYKVNDFTGHVIGLANDKEHSHEHNHDHSHHQHSHSGILNAIGDCKVVIAGGMGRRLYADFEQNNIQVFVTQEDSLDKALDLFLSNSLDNNTDKCCNH